MIKIINKVLKNLKTRKSKNKDKIRKMFESALAKIKKDSNKNKDKMGPVSSNQVQFMAAS